jgi:hypothetical protein
MSDIVVSAFDTVVPVTPTSTVPSAAGTTGDYIELAKQYLYTGSHEIRDKLHTNISPGDTALTLEYGNMALQSGVRLSCELEDMHVWAASADHKTATIERGQYGTAAASHSASKMVYFSPKFSDAEILREINNEIRDLPNSGIYSVATVEIATSPITVAYPLPFADDFEILEVRVRQIGPTLDWYVAQNWEEDRHAPTSDFPSGFSLNMRESVPVPSTIHVDYKLSFNALNALTDPVVLTTGMPPYLLDIPILGAAIRLAAGREIRRNFDEWQGETRRAGEVGPGANNAAPRNLMMLYQKRVVAESNRLQARYPKRKIRRWNSW